MNDVYSVAWSGTFWYFALTSSIDEETEKFIEKCWLPDTLGSPYNLATNNT